MDTDKFRALAEAIVALKPDWFADKVDVDRVKLALGEHGDIWPASIFEPEARETATGAQKPEVLLTDILDGLAD